MNNIKEKFKKNSILLYILIINFFLVFTINNKNTLLKFDISSIKIIYKLFLLVILTLPTIYFFILLLKRYIVGSEYLKKLKNCFIEITISIVCFMTGVYFFIAFNGEYWFLDIPLILTTLVYMYSAIIEININKYNINRIFWRYKIYFKPIVKKSVIRKNNEKESLISLMINCILSTLIYTIIICFPLGYFINFSSKIFYLIYIIIFMFQNSLYILDVLLKQYTKIDGVCTEVRVISKSRNTAYTITNYKTEKSIIIAAPIKKYKLNDKVTVIHGIFSKRVIDNFLTYE